jgi:hypothetical protein
MHHMYICTNHTTNKHPFNHLCILRTRSWGGMGGESAQLSSAQISSVTTRSAQIFSGLSAGSLQHLRAADNAAVREMGGVLQPTVTP